MRKNLKYALLTLVCCSSLFFVVPDCTLTADAATGNGSETVQPLSDVIQWVYNIENNKLYKRLYNSTKGVWVGDWIYVRDLTDEEIENLN